MKTFVQLSKNSEKQKGNGEKTTRMKVTENGRIEKNIFKGASQFKKKAYYSEIIEKNKSNQKQLFQIIKKLKEGNDPTIYPETLIKDSIGQ